MRAIYGREHAITAYEEHGNTWSEVGIQVLSVRENGELSTFIRQYYMGSFYKPRDRHTLHIK